MNGVHASALVRKSLNGRPGADLVGSAAVAPAATRGMGLGPGRAGGAGAFTAEIRIDLRRMLTVATMSSMGPTNRTTPTPSVRYGRRWPDLPQ